jgi:hypothetical protein
LLGRANFVHAGSRAIAVLFGVTRTISAGSGAVSAGCEIFATVSARLRYTLPRLRAPVATSCINAEIVQ